MVMGLYFTSSFLLPGVSFLFLQGLLAQVALALLFIWVETFYSVPVPTFFSDQTISDNLACFSGLN